MMSFSMGSFLSLGTSCRRLGTLCSLLIDLPSTYPLALAIGAGDDVDAAAAPSAIIPPPLGIFAHPCR